jgi:DNA-binding transcriptional LysR family regulator
MSLDFRNLRYFVAVAEELHFSRAAERLYIAQPALSEQISRLERDLGVQLLRRTTRKVELTQAGEEFLVRARRILAEADEAVADASRAARGEVGRLRVSTIATSGVSQVPEILKAFRAEHPSIELDLVATPWEDHSAGLRGGEADVAFVWVPFQSDGLELEPILSEPRLAALAADHPLAGRKRIRIAEIADEPWAIADTDPVALAFWNCEEYRDELTRREGPTIASMDSLLEAVRAGLSVAAVPNAIAAVQPWPGLVFVPITDIAPAVLAVGRRKDDDSALVAAFMEIARRARVDRSIGERL